MKHLRCWVVISLMLVVPCFAQDDADETPAGLLAEYSSKGHVAHRVDPDIAFVWGASSPDERLEAGPFSAKWTGQILLRGEGKTRFHAFVQGRIEVRLDDKVVVAGDAEKPSWLSGDEVDFGFGEKPFVVTFVRTGDAAQLKLFWSSTEFPLEPLPYHILFHEKTPSEIALAERGRVLFESHRCANCHGVGRETRVEGRDVERSLAPLAAPSLKHVGQGTTRAWLIDKLSGRGDIESKMPHFGFTRDEAADVVAALLEQSQPVKLDVPSKLKDAERDKDLKEGRTLIRSVGCLACHTHGTIGEAAPFGGGPLDNVGQRRSVEWLATWLADSKKINEHARMPAVTLSDKERAQVVLALLSPLAPALRGEGPGVRGLSGEQAPESQLRAKDAPHPNLLPAKPGRGDKAEDSAQAARGWKLIESARCSSCHEFAKPQSLSAQASSLVRGDVDWMKSCVRSEQAATNQRQPGQPQFLQVDAKAVQAYVASWGGRDASAVVSRSKSLDARRLLEQRNCLACHDRDGTKGLSRFAASIAKADESLSGLHMTLIPPRLNAVGDRMRDDALAEAVVGAPKSPRLNWLRVRMPRFQHTDAEKNELVSYLISHDRVPPLPIGQQQAAVTPSKATGEGTEPDPQTLLAGRELLGGKGFTCVACHAVKDYTPKVTALGTRGSNLHLLGQRMRPEYYYRWTRAPLRIMPGVEMPNYQRPHPTILAGKLDEQLTAIWHALNDPNLTSPTNPAVVEQLLTVNRGERPRIVRDVFTVPATVDDTVARAFAIGFDNGHSALFDLDTGSLRAWTLGDFARQRCEGKRWYWDLAGVPLASRIDKRPGIVLVDEKTGEVLAPESGWTIELTLQSHTDDSLRYRLTFTKDSATHVIDVSEVFKGTDNPSGWWRTLTVVGLEGSSLFPWYRAATPELLHASASITYQTDDREKPRGIPETARPFRAISVVLGDQRREQFVMVIHHTTSLSRVETGNSNPAAPPLMSSADRITSVPGFKGERLPLPRSIMPTAMTFDDRGRLIFTSLKGHVYRVDDANDAPRQSQAEVLPSPPSSGERARVRGPSGEDPSQPKPEAERTPHPNPLPSKARGDGTGEEKSVASVKLTMLAEGLAAPFGVMWMDGKSGSGKQGSRLLVAHKPELLELPMTGNQYDQTMRRVFATGWGITEDYHDWTCGIVRDSKGAVYVVTGSDYAFKARPKDKSRWRGHALRIDETGKITSIARGLRFPTGIAIDDQDRLFVTDQQGVQNTYNELNHVQEGHVYGVPSRHEENPNEPADPPVIQIPHPWTRSVNGVVFVPKRKPGDRIQKAEGEKEAVALVPSPPSSGERARVRGLNGEAVSPSNANPLSSSVPRPSALVPRPAEAPLTLDRSSQSRGEGTGGSSLALDSRPSSLDPIAGHFLAVEYNNNSIIRLTTQEVDGVVQGAAYSFSKPVSNDAAPLSFDAAKRPMPQDASSFIGPICIAIAPQGQIYVGSFQDGGWAGGLNMGDIVRLAPDGDLPNGIREIRATSRGFDIDFFHAVDSERARDPKQYKISGYTRIWKGDYATPDSGRHSGEVTEVRIDDTARTVSLTVAGLKERHVYDIAVGEIGQSSQRKLWPEIGYYTLHRIPK